MTQEFFDTNYSAIENSPKSTGMLTGIVHVRACGIIRTILISISHFLPPGIADLSDVEKPETPGESPDLGTTGLAGSRPLGLGIAVLPPLPPDTMTAHFLPSAIAAAAKKRPPSLPHMPPPPTSPPPPRIDTEVS